MAIYLSYGVKKVVPIVTAGVNAIQFWWQWALLVGTLVFFAYVEGYKGFQKGFSPRVVCRAWVVSQKFEVFPWLRKVQWRFYSVKESATIAKNMLKRYGVAYLLTSISFSIISFATMYALVSRGVDVQAILAAIGLNATAWKGKAGAVALAYGLHKAASPLRFPPTIALTPSMARLIGKQSDDDEDAGEEEEPSAPLWHKILAPAFCIGYFHGSRKRVISSWSVTTIIFLVVVGVRRLPNPYRAIIDAGVIVGLAWGTCSVLALYARSVIQGKPPDFDPALPEGTPYSALR